jgi:hypothetical protein
LSLLSYRSLARWSSCDTVAGRTLNRNEIEIRDTMLRVTVRAAPVVEAGGAGIGVAGQTLYVFERNGLLRGGDEEGMRRQVCGKPACRNRRFIILQISLTRIAPVDSWPVLRRAARNSKQPGGRGGSEGPGFALPAAAGVRLSR